MTRYDTVRKFKIIEEEVKLSNPTMIGSDDLSMPIIHSFDDNRLGICQSEPIPAQSVDGWRFSMNALYLSQQ